MKRLLLLLLSALLVLAGCSPATQAKVDPNAPNPIVTLEMENGDIIKMELYPQEAPNTVCNFISLVEQGFYDGLTFHRVLPGLLLQGGDPKGDGSGKLDYSILGEFSNNDVENNLKHVRGTVSMARQGNRYNPEPYYNTAGCQFFIVVAAAYPYWDGDYAAFGKVIEGIEVADAIASSAADAYNKPLEEQRIKKMTVETFGYDFPEPVKITK